MDTPRARVLARKYHIHLPGLVYAGITFLLVVGAINGQNNLLFWAFGLAVAGIVVSGITSGSGLMGVELRREIPARARAGEPLRVVYVVRNRNRWMPSFALTIEEIANADAHQGAARGPGAARVLGWESRMRTPTAFVEHVAARGEARAEAIVTPWRSGEVSFAAVRVSTRFPFGLTLKSVVFEQRARLIVHPWAPALRPGLLERMVDANERGSVAPRVSAAARAHEGDYFGVREYAAGDAPRSIAWRASARTGQLVVREHARRGARRLWLVPELPEDGLARERVLGLTAALAAQAHAERDELEIGLAAGHATLPPRSGAGHLRRILDTLATVTPATPATPNPSRHDTLIRVRAGHDDPDARTLGTEGGRALAPNAWRAAPTWPESTPGSTDAPDGARASPWRRCARWWAGALRVAGGDR